jgi:hypothetical protein
MNHEETLLDKIMKSDKVFIDGKTFGWIHR